MFHLKKTVKIKLILVAQLGYQTDSAQTQLIPMLRRLNTVQNHVSYPTNTVYSFIYIYFFFSKAYKNSKIEEIID